MSRLSIARRTVAGLVVIAALAACSDDPGPAEPITPAGRPSFSSHAGGLLPDLETVVPDHVQFVNAHKREWLRFSNGIANTGAGPLHIRPLFPLGGQQDVQGAVQDVFDAGGQVVQSQTVSSYEFHPTHNHWHIAGVALYEVRAGSADGPVVGGTKTKVTFCLIDWVKLEGKSRTTDRAYWDCSGAEQGISVGWVDQYHHATDDQDLDITGIPPGLYYLVSTSNPDGLFVESDYGNNSAWVAFELGRPAHGNPSIKVVAHSACTGGMCGSNPNR